MTYFMYEIQYDEPLCTVNYSGAKGFPFERFLANTTSDVMFNQNNSQNIHAYENILLLFEPRNDIFTTFHAPYDVMGG